MLLEAWDAKSSSCRYYAHIEKMTGPRFHVLFIEHNRPFSGPLAEEDFTDAQAARDFVAEVFGQYGISNVIEHVELGSR